MATGIAEIIIVSLIASWLLSKVNVPGLLGMLLVGVIFGPYALGWMDPSLLAIGEDLRLIALIVILLRAGFKISKRILHRVYGRALLLSFIPATAEGLAVTLIAPLFLPLSYFEAALLGSVVAAVSPAVVVPMMIDFIERGKGADKDIPSLVLAGASIDDVYVIVAHGVLVGLYVGRDVLVAWQVAGIPLSLVIGASVGAAVGVGLYKLFDRFNPRATKRVLGLIAISVLLVRLEHLLAGYVPFAAFVATMAIGFVILEKREEAAHEISVRLGKIWIFAEIILFSMVGAQVNLTVAWQAGLAGAAVIFIGLASRAAATYLCMLKSDFSFAERCFVVVSYMPKATVQAAIAAGPLIAMRTAEMDTAAGEIILAVGVLSIVLTAPAGAWAIRQLGQISLNDSGFNGGANEGIAESEPEQEL